MPVIVLIFSFSSNPEKAFPAYFFVHDNRQLRIAAFRLSAGDCMLCGFVN
jgi:hypothetical protein